MSLGRGRILFLINPAHECFTIPVLARVMSGPLKRIHKSLAQILRLGGVPAVIPASFPTALSTESEPHPFSHMFSQHQGSILLKHLQNKRLVQVIDFDTDDRSVSTILWIVTFGIVEALARNRCVQTVLSMLTLGVDLFSTLSQAIMTAQARFLHKLTRELS